MKFLNDHWHYLIYVLRHKWLVYRAGKHLKVSLWRRLKHDWSKFLPDEWFPYVKRWMTRDTSEECLKAFETAKEKHFLRNDHHVDHWQGKPMPEMCVREMLSDWTAMSWAQGEMDCVDWFLSMKDHMDMHPDTLCRVHDLLFTVPRRDWKDWG